MKSLLLSLLLTLVLELPFAWIWGLRKRDLAVVVIMNMITNPLVVLWHHVTLKFGLIVSVLLPEIAAVTAEALILVKFGRSVYRPVLLAICLNVFSYCAGWLLQYLLFS